MPFLSFGGNKKRHINLSDMNFFMKNRYSYPDPLGTGFGSTFSKCGSEDPDSLLWKGGSEDPDPDPLLPNVDPRIRIRIHIKMRWIRNAG